MGTAFRGVVFGRRRALCLLALPLLAACRYPADVESTLDTVEGGEMKVGLLVPLATFREMKELRVLEAVAERLGTTPVLVEGQVHDLLTGLEEGRIHLLAGGLPEKTPLTQRIGLTKRWGEAAIAGEVQPAAWGVRKGENAFLLALNRGIGEVRGALS
jgi:hypothetical protein